MELLALAKTMCVCVCVFTLRLRDAMAAALAHTRINAYAHFTDMYTDIKYNIISRCAPLVAATMQWATCSASNEY